MLSRVEVDLSKFEISSGESYLTIRQCLSSRNLFKCKSPLAISGRNLKKVCVIQ